LTGAFSWVILLRSSPGVLPADWSFAQAAPQLDLRSKWRPGGPCCLSGKVMSALPCLIRPLLFSIDLTVGYQCWGCADHGGSVCLGIGDDMMHSEDHQGVSTHSKADIRPEFVVGLRVRFSRLVIMRVRSWHAAEHKRDAWRAHVAETLSSSGGRTWEASSVVDVQCEVLHAASS
jgi:hypothetical protein